jgi:hypothetical protein
MTLLPTTTFVLSSAMFGAAATGAGRRLFRAERPRYSSPEYEQPSIRVIERVLGSTDVDFLARQASETRDLRRYLRGNRKEFLKLYLQQTRASFVAGARVAREFAADSDAPELAFAILRQTVRFHVLWGVLRLSLNFRWAGLSWRLAETLARAARFSGGSGRPDIAPSASS